MLGEDKQRLDAYFEKNNGYNDEDLHHYWKEHYNVDLGGEWTTRMRRKRLEKCPRLQNMLRWYARLQLGEKILSRVEVQRRCVFIAET